MKNLVTSYIKDESGATAIEYAMLAGLIGLGIIGGAGALGGGIDTKMRAVNTAVNKAK